MEEGFPSLISNAISSHPEGGQGAVSAALEGGYPGWRSIMLATPGFAVSLWFILGGVIYYQYFGA
jgi:hypothetical protein